MRALVLVLMLIAGMVPASSHEWYRGLENAAGQICCNERDCGPLADDDVEEVTGGYLIKSLGLTVPYGALQPSPDGRWHVCVWGGKARCFFGPLPSY